jgi:very-short-patch-repair endonuclease
MAVKNIVTNQNISETMYETARRLRREMTEEETILWENLRANRLGGIHFRRRQIIGKYIVDFYYTRRVWLSNWMAVFILAKLSTMRNVRTA